jgi:hypothetical protein
MPWLVFSESPGGARQYLRRPACRQRPALATGPGPGAFPKA